MCSFSLLGAGVVFYFVVKSRVRRLEKPPLFVDFLFLYSGIEQKRRRKPLDVKYVQTSVIGIIVFLQGLKSEFAFAKLEACGVGFSPAGCENPQFFIVGN